MVRDPLSTYCAHLHVPRRSRIGCAARRNRDRQSRWRRSTLRKVEAARHYPSRPEAVGSIERLDLVRLRPILAIERTHRRRRIRDGRIRCRRSTSVRGPGPGRRKSEVAPSRCSCILLDHPSSRCKSSPCHPVVCSRRAGEFGQALDEWIRPDCGKVQRQSDLEGRRERFHAGDTILALLATVICVGNDLFIGEARPNPFRHRNTRVLASRCLSAGALLKSAVGSGAAGPVRVSIARMSSTPGLWDRSEPASFAAVPSRDRGHPSDATQARP